MDEKCRIAVLLSSYNGEQYLREQLDSLLSQCDVDVTIVIRDDGSTDKTKDILKEYQQCNTNFYCLYEINCGAEESFNKLCQYAFRNIDADYFAFCDQDDVWEKDKIKKAIKVLKEYPENQPNLYFSNLKMVDENLQYLRLMFTDNEVVVNKKMALLQVFTYGCTCVFNKKALADYCTAKHNLAFHDVWMYEVCVFLGNVFYDPQSYILYRQHGRNLSGEKASGIKKWYLRLNKLRRRDLEHRGEIIAKQLICNFGDRLSREDYKRIITVADYRNSIAQKIRLLCSNNYRTGKLGKDFLNIVRVIINHV